MLCPDVVGETRAPSGAHGASPSPPLKGPPPKAAQWDQGSSCERWRHTQSWRWTQDGSLVTTSILSGRALPLAERGASWARPPMQTPECGGVETHSSTPDPQPPAPLPGSPHLPHAALCRHHWVVTGGSAAGKSAKSPRCPSSCTAGTVLILCPPLTAPQGDPLASCQEPGKEGTHPSSSLLCRFFHGRRSTSSVWALHKPCGLGQRECSVFAE